MSDLSLSPLRALLAAVKPDWIGLARLPNAMAQRGFQISAICPQEAFLTYARPLDHLITYQRITREGFRRCVLEEIGRFNPHIIIPGDDSAVGALHELHGEASPPVRELLERSLGKPEMYPQVLRKTALVPMAEKTGIAVPMSRVIYGKQEAADFAGEVEYPILLKLDQRAGGRGVFICRDAEELSTTYEKAATETAREKGPPAGIVAQQFINGATVTANFFALKGKVLANFMFLRQRTHPGPFGIASLAQFMDSPEILTAAQRVVEYFGVSGFGSVQFVLEEKTNRPLVMEMNVRPTPMAYLGDLFGSDQIAAMRCSITGEPSPAPLPPRIQRLAVFPNEWLRDPNSAELNDPTVYHDVPWNQPQLLAAIVRHMVRPPAKAAGHVS